MISAQSPVRLGRLSTTENACLRILSKPGYSYPALTVAATRSILAEFCQAGDHLFWADSISILKADWLDLSRRRAEESDRSLVSVTTRIWLKISGRGEERYRRRQGLVAEALY